MARCKYRRKLYKWTVLTAQDKVKSSPYTTANSLRSMSLTQSHFLTNLSSSSTIGLDAQPSARPMALHSSRSMGLDSVPSSITAHSIPSPCGVLRNIYLAHAQYHTRDWRISISVFNFHFHFPFPVSIPSFHFHFPFPVSSFHFQFPFSFSISSFHSTSISCFSMCQREAWKSNHELSLHLCKLHVSGKVTE